MAPSSIIHPHRNTRLLARDRQIMRIRLRIRLQHVIRSRWRSERPVSMSRIATSRPIGGNTLNCIQPPISRPLQQIRRRVRVLLRLVHPQRGVRALLLVLPWVKLVGHAPRFEASHRRPGVLGVNAIPVGGGRYPKLLVGLGEVRAPRHAGSAPGCVRGGRGHSRGGEVLGGAVGGRVVGIEGLSGCYADGAAAGGLVAEAFLGDSPVEVGHLIGGWGSEDDEFGVCGS